MRLVPTPLGYTYRLDYIPKGARNARAGLFRATDVAVVRHIEAREAELAFRVFRPELDVLPLSRPRTKPGTGWDHTRPASTDEIIRYDGSLWWAVACDRESGTGSYTAAEHCLSRIEKDHFFFEAQEIDESYDVAKDVPPIREVIANEQSEKLAQAKRKTYENVLICGEKAFIRGGLPIYFRNYHWRKTVWEIDVASIGHDRHGRPGACGLHGKPGAYAAHTTEASLGAGHFWLPTERRAAIHAGHRRQAAYPEIEVLMPELMRESGKRFRFEGTLFPEAVSELKPQIRLDALFREMVRMFSHPFCHHWRSRPFRSFKDAFDALCEPTGNDRSLSRARLKSLRSLVPSLADIDHWEINRIRDDFVSFDQSERADPTWPDDMSTEDLEALGSLAV